MEKIKNLISVYEDELKNFGRIKQKTIKNLKEIELIKGFISELKEIEEEYKNIVLTTIVNTTKLFVD